MKSSIPVDKTHRLPDMVAEPNNFGYLISCVSDFLSTQGGPLEHASVDRLSRLCCSYLRLAVSDTKKLVKLNHADAVPLYNVRVTFDLDSHGMVADIAFTTNWKFFPTHKQKPYYRYSMKVTKIA